MNATHLRYKKEVKNKKGKAIEAYDPRVITIVSTPFEGIGDGPAYACGWSFSHSQKGWQRKKALAIAKGRLQDSPIRFYFDSVGEIELPQLVSTVKAYLLAGVQWDSADERVLRPSRFNWRIGGQMLGPDGSLVSVFFDTRASEFLEDKRKVLPLHESNLGKPEKLDNVTHWALKSPSWVPHCLEFLS
jgi:hypothetical protein